METGIGTGLRRESEDNWTFNASDLVTALTAAIARYGDMPIRFASSEDDEPTFGPFLTPVFTDDPADDNDSIFAIAVEERNGAIIVTYYEE